MGDGPRGTEKTPPGGYYLNLGSFGEFNFNKIDPGLAVLLAGLPHSDSPGNYYPPQPFSIGVQKENCLKLGQYFKICSYSEAFGGVALIFSPHFDPAQKNPETNLKENSDVKMCTPQVEQCLIQGQ